jgi:hypothetical protein
MPRGVFESLATAPPTNRNLRFLVLRFVGQMLRKLVPGALFKSDVALNGHHLRFWIGARPEVPSGRCSRPFLQMLNELAFLLVALALRIDPRLVIITASHVSRAKPSYDRPFQIWRRMREIHDPFRLFLLGDLRIVRVNAFQIFFQILGP